MKQIQITKDKTDSTFTASVCDAGSYFERNFSGCTMTIWPGDALSSLDTSELKVWRKVKSSLSAWPDRQTDRRVNVPSTPHVHLKNSILRFHHTQILGLWHWWILISIQVSSMLGLYRHQYLKCLTQPKSLDRVCQVWQFMHQSNRCHLKIFYCPSSH